MLRSQFYNPLNSGSYVTVCRNNPNRKWVTIQNTNQATNPVMIYLGEQRTMPYAYLDKFDSLEFNLSCPFYGEIVAYCAGDVALAVSEYD